MQTFIKVESVSAALRRLTVNKPNKISTGGEVLIRTEDGFRIRRS